MSSEPRAVRLGRAIGNWNDRHSNHDRNADAPLRWRILDRLAGWLYTRHDGDGWRRDPVTGSEYWYAQDDGWPT